MCEPFYKAGSPKATSGPPGPCWEEGVLGHLLAGERKNLAGVSFPPGSPVIKKGSLGKFMGQGPHGDGDEGPYRAGFTRTLS